MNWHPSMVWCWNKSKSCVTLLKGQFKVKVGMKTHYIIAAEQSCGTHNTGRNWSIICQFMFHDHRNIFKKKVHLHISQGGWWNCFLSLGDTDPEVPRFWYKCATRKNITNYFIIHLFATCMWDAPGDPLIIDWTHLASDPFTHGSSNPYSERYHNHICMNYFN